MGRQRTEERDGLFFTVTRCREILASSQQQHVNELSGTSSRLRRRPPTSQNASAGTEASAQAQVARARVETPVCSRSRANAGTWPSPVQAPYEGLDRPREVDDATTKKPVSTRRTWAEGVGIGLTGSAGPSSNSLRRT
jgi:hypothetical protein